jgi:hypothetical protein
MFRGLMVGNITARHALTYAAQCGVDILTMKQLRLYSERSYRTTSTHARNTDLSCSPPFLESILRTFALAIPFRRVSKLSASHALETKPLSHRTMSTRSIFPIRTFRRHSAIARTSVAVSW